MDPHLRGARAGLRAGRGDQPAHAKALKGHKTDAKDALRLAELFERGLLRGSYIPSQTFKDLRDLTR